MSQNLQNFVKFQQFQLENLLDFEKCCKTHIFLQKSEPIQPKTSESLRWTQVKSQRRSQLGIRVREHLAGLRGFKVPRQGQEADAGRTEVFQAQLVRKHDPLEGRPKDKTNGCQIGLMLTFQTFPRSNEVKEKADVPFSLQCGTLCSSEAH